MGRNHTGTSNWYQIKTANQPVDLRWVNLSHVTAISANACQFNDSGEPSKWMIVLHGVSGYQHGVDLRLYFDSLDNFQEEMACIEELIMPPLEQ